MSESLAAQITEEVMRALDGGPRVLVATVIATPDGTGVGTKLLVRADGSTLGTLNAPALEAAVRGIATDAVRPHGLFTVYLRPDGTEITRRQAADEPSSELMIEVHERPERLLIVGGGHVGKALSLMGSMCGFRITVVDDRSEYASEERFPEAEEILHGRFEEILRAYPVDADCYIVCVTRGHKHDEVSLRQVVGRGAAYVGMIGSQRRVAAVLQHLREDGVPDADLEPVHTPIGLDIGAQTPEEIAVSIMAEIIQTRRGPPRADGRQLRETRRTGRNDQLSGA